MPNNRNQGQKWIRNTRRCALFARDSFACVYCCDATNYLTLDHIDPCGGNGSGNLVSSCLACNDRKGERTVDEWLVARVAAGEPAGVGDGLRTRVRLAIESPVDMFLGRALERRRARGAGSFGRLRHVVASIRARMLSETTAEVA